MHLTDKKNDSKYIYNIAKDLFELYLSKNPKKKCFIMVYTKIKQHDCVQHW